MSKDGVLIEDSPGAKTIMHEDASSGDITFERKINSKPILDDVARINQITDGKSKTGEFYHIARLDPILCEAYCHKNGITWNEFMTDDVHITRILNDPDYAHFRIWKGRV
jgi:hypothetical protein